MTEETTEVGENTDVAGRSEFALLSAIEAQQEFVYAAQKRLMELKHEFLEGRGWKIEPCSTDAFFNGFDFTYSKDDDIFLDIDRPMDAEDQ